MRTALEMANFYTGWIDLSDPAVRDQAAKKLTADIESLLSVNILSKRSSARIMKFLNYDQALREVDRSMREREEPRRKLADLFRPVERALGPNDEVVYALVLSNIVFSSKKDPVLQMKNILKPGSANAAVAFTADRCIIVDQTWRRDSVRIIPYDDITGIQPFVQPFIKNGEIYEGGITLHLPYDSISFVLCPWTFCTDTAYVYSPSTWAPWANYNADILEIVTRYKQGKAQKTYAAPQAQDYAPTSPQAAPQQAPAAPQTGAVPQEEAIEAMKRFKELLDMGILTQEEFDAKKKQMLGL